jgi:hypothetical protein
MTLTIDSVLVQDREPAAAALDDGVVLLSLRAGSYFNLNSVASEIWGMLTEPRCVAQIFDTLRETHDVDAETLSRDVTPFLQTLVDERLLRLVEPADAR